MRGGTYPPSEREHICAVAEFLYLLHWPLIWDSQQSSLGRKIHHLKFGGGEGQPNERLSCNLSAKRGGPTTWLKTRKL